MVDRGGRGLSEREAVNVYSSYGKNLRSARKGCRCRRTGGRKLCWRGRKAETRDVART